MNTSTRLQLFAAAVPGKAVGMMLVTTISRVGCHHSSCGLRAWEPVLTPEVEASVIPSRFTEAVVA
jgi:hypothetical protein